MEKGFIWAGGLIIGLASGILLMYPRTQPNAAFAARCRARCAAVAAMSQEDRARFLEGVRAHKEARISWEIVEAVSRIGTEAP